MAATENWDVEPLEEAVDHVRGPAGAGLVLVYGDFECPYTRRAVRELETVAAELAGALRVAFRHFPLTDIHPHALGASLAAEAAAAQGRFWEMHDLLFHRQKALEDDELRGYADSLGLDPGRFEIDRRSDATLERVQRDVHSGVTSGYVRGTPTLFVDGVFHRGGYDAASLLAALGR
jgi:protein-disulfide isomerase